MANREFCQSQSHGHPAGECPTGRRKPTAFVRNAMKNPRSLWRSRRHGGPISEAITRPMPLPRSVRLRPAGLTT